jgi:hypothetical protein
LLGRAGQGRKALRHICDGAKSSGRGNKRRRFASFTGMPSLKPGQLLRCVDSNAACRVEALIGDGGQGEVYRVHLDGETYALKWYNDVVLRIDAGLRSRLQVAIDHGPPSPSFLWPFELVTLPDGSRLGYLMRLRQPSWLKIQSVLAQEVRPSFRVLAMIGWQLTEALLALHAKGLIYQDLNAGNVFFDPASGRIELCDNDNVDVDGAPSVMGGVWEFQAPEVVLRQSGPSRATDLHSLAVMLFRLLHIGHPLIGRCELHHPNLTDPSVLRRLYGTEARFVFDPGDESNRPLPERHGPVLGHWAIYPHGLRQLFTRAFTVGLYDPAHGRVQETEWRRALRHLHDAVFRCPRCSAQNFYDPQRLAEGRRTFACWGCGADLPSAPPRIGIRRQGAKAAEAPLHVLVLDAGARLYAHHMGEGDGEGAAPWAELQTEPVRALRNLGPRPWRAWRAGAAGPTEVAPGAALAVEPSLRVEFGRAVGEIKA